LCVAYKLNIAFFEVWGKEGWLAMERILPVIPNGLFIIADAKRGDIGNSSRMYANAFFKNFDFDAITLSPYMGSDSVGPFLAFSSKWVILLALTSNTGSSDFQLKKLENGKFLYEEVIELSQGWEMSDKLMYVVGATHPDELKRIRALIPHSFILMPGIGAQGGDMESVISAACTNEIEVLINVSRAILYGVEESVENYFNSARERARAFQTIMNDFMNRADHFQ
jgi:orotidine-5'-phosphate decarboxylase